MPAGSRPGTRPSMRGLLTHFRTPLYRDGYALIASAGLTSILGLLYWGLAARRYSVEVVGLNSAALSAMLFIANIAQLNLVSALNRFLPRAGRATGRIVAWSYVVSVTVSLAAGSIFILGIPLWSPSLGFLRSSWLFAGGFVAATMANSIFMLQDGALTGLRQARWVPVENVGFAVAKAILVVALASRLSQYGIVVSWVIPLVISLLPVNLLLFRRLIPRHGEETAENAEPLRPSDIRRFVAGNYLGSLVWIATTNLLPVLVLERAGAEENARFYIAWTIANSLYLVSRSMGMSAITEGTRSPRRLYLLTYKAFMQNMLLLLPVVAIVWAAAPWILRALGEHYAESSSLLLRLLALSAIPYAFTSAYLSVAKVEQRLAGLVVSQTALCLIALALSLALLGSLGIAGIGAAWLVAQTLVAAAVFVLKLGPAWLPFAAVGGAVRALGVIRSLTGRRLARARLRNAARVLREFFSDDGASTGSRIPSSWVPLGILPTVSDLTVAFLGPRGDDPAKALIKVPRTSQAAGALATQSAVIAELRGDARLGSWRELLPVVACSGKRPSAPFAVEWIIPGVEGRTLIRDPSRRLRLLQAAVEAIGRLHTATAHSLVSAAEREAAAVRLVRQPAEALRAATRGRLRDPHAASAIEQLASDLERSIRDRPLVISWVHGDYAPRNILATPDGAEVTGVVDWDLARPDDLPELDVAWLFLATRMTVGRRDLGVVVREMLDRGNWSSDEEQTSASAQSFLARSSLDTRSIVWLCWLRHVVGSLTKASAAAASRYWLARNVEGVLCCV